MNVIIIGHGPSLVAQPNADYIDSFDYVVRQKMLSTDMMKRPEHFGTKTDAIVGSWNQGPWMNNKYERWVFIDSRFDHLEDSAIRGMEEEYGVRIDKPLCDQWNVTFRKQRTEPIRKLPDGMERKSCSDNYGHRHMSSGLHALLYTCAFLMPDRITLIGYDNVQHGGFTWSLARGPEWKHYPDHRWDVEQKLVPQISKAFNVPVNYAEKQCAA